MASEKERSKIAKIAQKYAKKGKFHEAITEYQKLLTENSLDINVRSTIGDLYVRSNQREKAIEEFLKIAGHYEERGLYSQSIAVYKKINKLNPDDFKIGMKLADLYHSQGFTSEAKREYQKIAGILKESNKIKEAIRMYEKLLKLDENDIQSRLTLAQLFKEEKLFDQAVEEFNKVAEIKIQNNALKEAEEILDLAKDLKEDHSRTTANLISLLQKGNKSKEALGLINKILEKDKENVEALNLLGQLYFEEKDFKKAEEIYSKIVTLRAKDVDARIKLGRVYIQQERLDEAFDIYEPLVDSLVKKQKAEKAIGLLGLILKSKKVHLSTLEKLASVFKSINQKKNLEVARRVVLEEYQKRDLKKEALAVLSELVNLCPEDQEIKNEYTLLGKELGFPEEGEEEKPVEEEERVETVEIEEEEEKPIEIEEAKEKAIESEEEKVEAIEEEEEEERAEELVGEEEKVEAVEIEKEKEEAIEIEEEQEIPIEVEELVKEEEEKPIEEETKEEPLEIIDEAKDAIEKNLAQVDSYLDQGLVKSAKRILENLRIEYPDEPRIDEKLAALEEDKPQVKEEVPKAEEKEEKPIEEEKREEPSKVKGEAEEGLDADLAQVDSYIEEGMVKSAKRVLANLRIEYPDEPRIEEKLEVLKGIAPQAKAEKILKDKEKKRELKREEKREEPSKVRGEAEEGLEADLAQADLYKEQGLAKSAKRILENLRIEYPDEPRIEEKLAALEGVAARVKDEEIHKRVEKVSEKETELIEKKVREKMPHIPEKEGEERITSAEVFADTDITPVVPKEKREKEYYDLVEKIDGELDVIKTVTNSQLAGKTTVFEKELADIVAEFTEALEEEVDKEDYESHFNLGIAFLEQGLIDEAIQELKLASQDEKRAVECYSVLSHCFRKKKDFQEAVKWIEKALKLSDKDSSQSFDLKYELASLYGDLRETKKALSIYGEIKNWNAEYRDVAKKIEKLNKS
ncbi:MAG: tetratricopeptide repeat protein [Candidatus Aminicenantes bacterium]|nr:MAG: tetratricopeptide repeat protein [Candidatus Aminicenantes bacterium]